MLEKVNATKEGRKGNEWDGWVKVRSCEILRTDELKIWNTEFEFRLEKLAGEGVER
jgi:hypothetical protein